MSSFSSFNDLKNMFEKRIQNAGKANNNKNPIQKTQTLMDDNPIVQKLKTQKSEVKLKIPSKNESFKKETEFNKKEAVQIMIKTDNFKKEHKNKKSIKENKDTKENKDNKEKKNNIQENKEKKVISNLIESKTNKNNKGQKKEDKESNSLKANIIKDNKEVKEKSQKKENKENNIDLKRSLNNNLDKKENKKEEKNLTKDKEKKIEKQEKEQTPKNNEEKKIEIKRESKELDNSNLNIDSKEEYFQNLDDFKNIKKSFGYNFSNIENGNIYFKNRYIEEKLNEIDKTIKEKINLSRRSSSSINDSNYEKENEKRKCNTEFLLIKEKAIISFNLKKYEESFQYLKNSGVIKNEEEFGTFLLIISGFDKFILGEFLAKEKPPNDTKVVLSSFLNSIDMDFKNVTFLDSLRFLLSRLVLPKDANLILVIMETFSEIILEKNKNDEEFIRIFKNNDAIYLLISTILALNTMFTRKDIKNMNVIKKEEFKSMNKDIEPSYADDLYEKLKKDPISLNGDYNEDIYKKLSTLAQVKTKDINSKKLDTLKRVVTIDKEKDDSSNRKKESKEITDNNNKEIEDNKNNNENKNNNLEANIMEQQYYEFIQDFMDLDIVRKTLRGSYNRKSSFNININLINFNEEDKKLLSKPNKFYRIQGSSTPILREFIVFDDFKKLAFDKTIDVTKPKYKKFIEISDINNVYLGIDHGDNIKKYIKVYPQDKQLSNNFISIIYNNHKEQIDIKTDDTNLAITWYKAMKSLLIKTKNKDEKTKIAYSINKLKEIRGKISLIWEENILTHWNEYMKYIIVKIYEKNNYFQNILMPSERQTKLVLLDDKKTLNTKAIEDFLKEINDRFNKSSNNKLEYNEFLCLCYLGFPHKMRKTIWKIGIENNLGFTKNLYLYYQADLNKQKIDFCELDFRYRENSNVQLNPDYKLNQIIIDIIKIRYIFLQEINAQQLDENELMKKVYNITVSFNLIRFDIPYNKGIVSLVYFFLLTGMDEINCFICISNLICSRNIYKLYLGEEETINKQIAFFNKLLKDYSEKVYEHLKKLEINPELYLIPWFERLFTQSLDFHLLLHVFDLYLFNGDYVLFQTALTIIKLVEEDLLNLTVSEVFKMFKRLPIKYTELNFFEVFKSLNCIKDEYIFWNKNNVLKLQKQEIEIQITKDIYDNSIKEIENSTKNEK